MGCTDVGYFYFTAISTLLLITDAMNDTVNLNYFPAKSCQPVSAFCIISTKLSWPPEYYVVWISEHVIGLYQKKRTDPLLLNGFILASCFLFFFINVGKFHKATFLTKTSVFSKSTT